MSECETIFVSIPSLEDTELIPTLIDAFEKAKNPKRIFIGVAYSSELNNIFAQKKLTERFKSNPNVEFKFLNWKKNYGVSFGRLACGNFYRNEDYFLQIDSHTLFDRNWDEQLINLFKNARNTLKENKIILSGYPAHYQYNDRGQRALLENSWHPMTIKFNGDSYANRIFANTDKVSDDHFSRLIPSWVDIYPQELWNDYDRKFLYSAKISGGFVFGDKNLGIDYKKMYPYNYSFIEEEIISSVELFDLGYKFVCPAVNVPIAHLYSIHINEYGGSRKFYQMSDALAEKYKYLYLEYIKLNYDKLKKYENAMGIDLIKNKLIGNIKKPESFEYLI